MLIDITAAVWIVMLLGLVLYDSWKHGNDNELHKFDDHYIKGDNNEY